MNEVICPECKHTADLHDSIGCIEILKLNCDQVGHPPCGLHQRLATAHWCQCSKKRSDFDKKVK